MTQTKDQQIKIKKQVNDHSDQTSIFTKIIKRELPAKIRYEDEEFIAFDDIHPAAPIHVLLIPKHAYPSLEAVSLTDPGFHARLLLTARRVASFLGIAENYKLFMNVGARVQAVHHLHLHITGGWSLKISPAELEQTSLELHQAGLPADQVKKR